MFKLKNKYQCKDTIIISNKDIIKDDNIFKNILENKNNFSIIINKKYLIFQIINIQ